VLEHVAIGDWQETPAGRRVLMGPMTIARSRPERILQPSAWVQNRASPGRSACRGTHDVTPCGIGMGNSPGWWARLGFCRVASTGARGRRAGGSTV
jgi:hypothetical protein